jgi:hypothetical protein
VQGAAGEAPGAASGPLASEIPFVGRTAELTRLRRLVDAMGQGRGQVLVLLGAAGVGKSRLVAELAASVVREGHGVHVGRCHEAEQILPFRAWTDALREADISDAVTGLAAPWRVELARLFPEVVPEAIDRDGRPPDHARLFEAIARLLARLCASRPLALVLEDVHGADEMSLRLLAFVGRRIATDPVLLVATAREEDLAEVPLLDRIVGDLGTAAHVTRLSLSPLARDETAGLVRALRPTKNQESIAGIIEETWSASEGNPFVVVEMLRALERLGLPYCITGSVAASVYGEPRLTADIDVALLQWAEDIAALRSAFPDSAYYVPPEETLRLEAGRGSRGIFNLIPHVSQFKADIYLAARDPLHACPLARRRRIDLEGGGAWIAPPEYVILRELECLREGGQDTHVRDIRFILAATALDHQFLDAEVARRGLLAQWLQCQAAS